MSPIIRPQHENVTPQDGQESFFLGIWNGRLLIRGELTIRTVLITIWVVATITGYPTIITVVEKFLRGGV